MSARLLLTKAYGDYKFKKVELKGVDEDGKDAYVYVRTLDATERQAFDVAMVKIDKKKKPQFKYGYQMNLLISMTLCDGAPPDSKLAFTSVADLCSVIKDNTVLDTIYAASAELNDLGQGGNEEADGKGEDADPNS